MRHIDITDQKFGRLTAVRRATNQGQCVMYECKCTCGNTTVVRSEKLRTRKTKSCGCLVSSTITKRNRSKRGIPRLPNNRAAFNLLWKQYTDSAKQRKLAWEISRVDFESLIQARCAFCNSLGDQRILRKPSVPGGHTTTIKCNGIDRIENNEGYVEGNLFTCCKRCNYMKSNLPLMAFIYHVARIFNYSCVNSNGQISREYVMKDGQFLPKYKIKESG